MKLSFGRISLLLTILPLAGVIACTPAQAQPIKPAADGTGRTVTQDDTLFNISGGTLSGNRANLFYSFEQFGLSSDQTTPNRESHWHQPSSHLCLIFPRNSYPSFWLGSRIK